MKTSTKVYSILFFAFLLAFASSKKSMTKTHTKINSASDITKEEDGNKCFFGTIGDLDELASGDADAYIANIKTKKDSDQLIQLIDAFDYVIKAEVSTEENATENLISEYLNLKSSLKIETGSALDISASLAKVDTTTSKSSIFELFYTLLANVLETNFSNAPKSLKTNLYKAIQYKRQSAIWGVKYENKESVCYPTNKSIDIFPFKDITKINCGSVEYTRPGQEFIISDESLLKGGIAISFWGKISIELLEAGNSAIMQITKSNNTIKLTTEKGEDNQSINIVLSINDKVYSINNTADCSDLVNFLIVVQKDADRYVLYVIMKSYILNNRIALTAELPSTYIENATFEAINPIVTDQKNILFIQNFGYKPNYEKTLRKEYEILSLLIDENIESTVESMVITCQKPISNCDYINDDASCGICDESFFSYEGACVEVCPEGTFIDSTGEACFACSSKCLTCSTFNECLSCAKDKNLFNKTCEDVCPDNTWPNKKTNAFGTEYLECIGCTKDCQICSGKESCKQCNTLFLYEDKCIEKCPESFYTSFSPNQCKPCIESCVSCIDGNTCVRCDEKHILSPTKQCDTDCAKTYFIKYSEDKTNNVCASCSEKCNECVDENECITCADEYNLLDGKCITDCPAGHVPVKGVCIPCEKNCNSCMATNVQTCTECNNNYFVFNDDCVDNCGDGMYPDTTNKCQDCLDNCLSCENSITCNQCNDKFFLFNNGEKIACLDACPNGYVAKGKSCIKCSGNCKECYADNLEKCRSCNDDFYLYNDTCTDICLASTYVNDKACYDCEKSCSTCNNSYSCLTCPKGEYLHLGLCVTACPAGFTINNLECVKCEREFCDVCDTDKSICDDCAEKKVLFNGKCSDKCPPEHFNKDGVCESCSLNCSQCENSTKCTLCNLEYFLTLDGVCVDECPTNTTSDLNNSCQTCSDSTCHRCDLETKLCTSCSIGTFLHEGTCKESCPETTYSNEDKRACINCSAPCVNCALAADKCTSCIKGYSLLDDECADSCPINYANVNNVCKLCKNKNCDTCSPNDLALCENCIPNNYLFETLCYTECPKYYYAEKENLHCEHCINSCLTCSNSTECEVCDDGYYLSKNKLCVEKCSDGYVADDSDKKCKKCKDTCLTCQVKNTDLCTSCLSGKFLLNNECIDKCPSGYYADSTNTCQKCLVDKCDICKDITGDTCSKCITPNYLLGDNLCLDSRPKGYRITGFTLEKCSVDKCDYCDANKEICEECLDEFLLYGDNKCLAECPIGTFECTSSKKCKDCGTNCSACINSKRCTQCDGAHVLRQDEKCYTTCPCGQVNQNGICKDCSENCKNCTPEDPKKCTVCYKGFFLDSNYECVKDCGPGFYENSSKRTCESCSTNCNECSDYNHCTECVDPFNLYNNACYDECPDKFADVENVCTPCKTSELCEKCSATDLNECINCGENILFNKRCLIECPESHYLLGNHTCGQCISNCLTCKNGISCETCVNGYSLKGSTCTEFCGSGYTSIDGVCKKCKDVNCNTCSSNLECSICNDNYLLFNYNGVNDCLDQCPDYYFNNGKVCSPCSNENCLQCSTESECTSCNAKSFLYNKDCIAECPEGFYVEGNVCKACESGCSECSNKDPTVCSTCFSPKVLHEGDCLDICPEYYVEKTEFPGVCTKCQDNCIKCSKSSDECLNCDGTLSISHDGKSCVKSCESGYVSEEYKCKSCAVENCHLCSNSVDISCQTCTKNHLLSIDSKQCLDHCPKAQFALNSECQECDNCPSCEDKTGQCTECYDGYFLFEGVCKQDCIDGQIQSNGECLDCSVDNCKTCPATDLETCSDCISPYKLYNNICYEEKCPPYTFLGSLGKKCYECSANCTECESASICNVCESPFVLQGNVCKTKCDSGYVNISGVCTQCGDFNKCKVCDIYNLDSCTVCNSDFTLLGKKCETSCGNNMYENSLGELGRVCLPCEDNCKECSNSKICTVCQSGYNLYENDCIENCPSGWISDNKVCKKCSSDNCNICKTNLNSCTVCKSGFYLLEEICKADCGDYRYEMTLSNGNGECRDCKSDCITCSDSATCELCGNDKYLYSNNCISSCPAGWVSDSNRICQKCTQDSCGVCSLLNLDDCSQCKSGYLYNKRCDSSCPSDGYYGFENKCYQCLTSCKQCNNSSRCDLCDEGYFLDDDRTTCKSDCGIGAAAINTECVDCQIKNCAICNNDVSKCSLCASPYRLQGNKCVEKCDDGFYALQGVCTACEDNCIACKDNTTCTKCSKDTVLFNEDCLSECPKGFYHTKDDNVCLKCEAENCSQCDAENSKICTGCADKYYLYDTACRENCPLTFFNNSEKLTCDDCSSNCSLCDSFTNCTKCSSNYVLYNKECLSECPSGYVNDSGICKECTGTDCFRCQATDLSKCTSCVKDTFFYFSKCLGSCPEISTYATVENKADVCKNCKSNCLTCKDDKTCTSCQGTLTLFEGDCIDTCPDNFVSVLNVCRQCQDSGCKNCNTSELDVCYECLDGYFLLDGYCVKDCTKIDGYFNNKDTKECNQCKANCDDCTNSTNCTKCFKGFYFVEETDDCEECLGNNLIIGDICKTCKADICSVCVDQEDKTCQYCDLDYALIEGKCYENCPEKTYKYGQSCIDCISGCSVCNNKETCQICDADKVKLGDVCTDKCPIGYVMDSKRNCKKCTQDSCEICTPNNLSNCTNCISSFILSTDGFCYESCPHGTYKDGESCKKCDENCTSCNADSCTICDDKFYLKNGTCVNNCGSGYYLALETKTCEVCDVENCSKCADGCTLCKEPYLLLNGECKLSCPDGFYESGTTCAPCETGCSICKSPDTCITCNDNLYLYEDVCIPTCPKYMAPVNNVCQPCTDSRCMECENHALNVCLNCETGYLIEGRCVDVCPEGTYINNDNKNCEYCNTICKNCSSKDVCTSCNNELILYEDTCINQCPDGTVKNNGDCESCIIDGCSTCKITSSTNFSCIKCKQPYILYNEDCVSECPTGYYHDVASNTCSVCASGCKSCNTVDTCIECKSGFFYDNLLGKCTQSCSPFTYANCATKTCISCDASCDICNGPTNSDCLTCKDGYLKMNNSCVSETNCAFGYYPSVTLKKCIECDIAHCDDCDSSAVCTKCNSNYALKDGVCQLLSSIRSPLLGNFFESPKAYTNYGQKNVYNLFNDLKFTQASSDLTISFFLRSLGPTEFSTSNISEVLKISNDSASVSVNVNHETKKCQLSVTKTDTKVQDSTFECGNHKLFSWQFFALTINKDVSSDNSTITLKKYNSTTKSFDEVSLQFINFAKGNNIIDSASNISLLNETSHDNAAYQLTKLNVSNAISSVTELSTFSSSTPSTTSWLCNTPSSCTSGFIPLANGFSDLPFTKNLYDSDIIINDKLGAAFTKFGISTYIYITSEIADGDEILSISYNYDNSSLKSTNALSLKVDKKAKNKINANLNGRGNDVVIQEVFESNKWYIVLFGVTVKSDSLSYELKILNNNKIELLNETIDVATEQGIKLYIDAEIEIASGKTGQLYNTKLLLNELSIDNLPSIPTITGNNNCKSFNYGFACVECKKNYILQKDGTCLDDTFNLSSNLFHLFSVYSTKYIEYEIPTDYALDDFTVYISMRKLVHSIYEENSIAHRLIGYRDNLQVKNLITETVFENYISKFDIGDTDFNFDFSCSEFDYFKVIIVNEYSKQTATVYIITPDDNSYKGVIELENKIEKLVIGDEFGSEINMEFKQAIIYPKALNSEEITEIIKTEVIDSDPTCKDVDFSSGLCHQCIGSINTVDSTKCNHSINGFSYNYIYGHTAYSQISNLQSYVFKLKEQISENVNSNSYGVFGRFRFLAIPEIKSNSSAIYNVFKVRNNSHAKYYENDPSNNLISLNLKVEKGEPSYYWLINSVKGVQTIDIPFDARANQWILVSAMVNVTDRSFTYHIFDDSSYEIYHTDTIKYNDCVPERLQSVGELISFGALSNSAEKYKVPNGETNNLYLVANLHEYEKVLYVFQNRFKPVTPSAIDNCNVTIYKASISKSVCIECDPGFIIINGVCTIAQIKPIIDGQEVEYTVLSDYIQFNDEEFPLYSLADDSLDFSFYFRNNFSLQESRTPILKAGLLELFITSVDYQIFLECTYDGNINLLGPIRDDTIFYWHNVFVSFDKDSKKEINIYLRESGSNISNVLDSLTLTTTQEIVIPTTATMFAGNSQFQAYGLHLLNGNYAYPAFGEPYKYDCGIDCTNCYLSLCSSGLYGVSNGRTNLSFIEFNNTEITTENSPVIAKLSDKFESSKLLRSNTFSLSLLFIPNLSAVTMDTDYFLIFEIELSSSSTISLKVNKNDLTEYVLSYKNYIINTTTSASPQKTFKLQNKIQQASIAIILSLVENKINLIVYDTHYNYKVVTETIEGDMDFLTRAATVSFGSDVTSVDGNNLALYKSISISYDREIELNNFLSHSYSLINTTQAACTVFDHTTGNCSECKEGYILALSNESHICVLEGAIIAESTSILYASDEDELAYEYDLTKFDTIERISLISTIQYPYGYSSEVGIIQINSNDIPILEIYAKNSGIHAINNITGKYLNIADVDTGNKAELISIVSTINTLTGYSKILVYIKSSDKILSAESVGTSSENIDFANITVRIGFNNGTLDSEKSYFFKSGTNVLYVNNVLTETNILDLSYNNNACSQSCLVDCSSSGICPATSIILDNFDIKTTSNSLFNSLEAVIPKLTSTEEFYNYGVDIVVTQSTFTSGDFTNSNVLFVLSNRSKSSYNKFKIGDLIPDSLHEKNSLAVLLEGDNLVLNLFGGVSGTRYSLLPVGYNFSSFNTIRVQLVVHAYESTVNALVHLDDIVYQFNIELGKDDWSIEAINKETIVFNSPGIDSSKINLRKDVALEEITAALTPVQQNCNIENCSLCLVDQTGEQSCKTCAKNFTSAIVAGTCVSLDIITKPTATS